MTASSPELVVQGGSAARHVREWRRFLYITRALAVTEFKLRYFGSVLGYLWTLFRPLIQFGVLYLVFTRIIRFGDDVPHYPVLLLAGIVLWTFFADATSTALGSLVARESLLRKLAFPRITIPIATTATAAANLVLGLAVLLLLAVVDGVDPSATWLYVVPISLGLMVFAIGLSLLLSVMFVRFRDVQPIWEIVLQILFWGSPVIYMIDFVPEGFREYVLWNPFAAAVQETRHQLVPDEPSVAAVLGSTPEALIPVAIALAFVILGLAVFAKLSRRIAERL
jgi:ABC-2 type transport system permease protein